MNYQLFPQTLVIFTQVSLVIFTLPSERKPEAFPEQIPQRAPDLKVFIVSKHSLMFFRYSLFPLLKFSGLIYSVSFSAF